MKAILAWLAFAGCLCAQEKKDAPKIIGVSPLMLFPGKEVTLKFRGLKLDTATEARFPNSPDLKATISEKKAASIPTGLEARDVGDKEISVKATLPADQNPGPLAIELLTPEGVLKCELPVFAASSVSEEKESNNGFTTAQPLEMDRRLSARIGEDKDVDVFSFSAKAGERFAIEVNAARSGSLLDATLTLYDHQHHVVAQCDDADGRDPKLNFDAKADGRYFLVVQDAHDRGGPWHGYSIMMTGRK